MPATLSKNRASTSGTITANANFVTGWPPSMLKAAISKTTMLGIRSPTDVPASATAAITVKIARTPIGRIRGPGAGLSRSAPEGEPKIATARPSKTISAAIVLGQKS